jgi:hypothetical protein
VIRRLRRLFRRRGGTMPAPSPLKPGERRVILSPGWVPPEVARRYPPEFIDRINRGRRP